MNQLLDQDGFAHARAAEQPDFAAFQVRLDQVHNLDARLEHFELCGLVFERRRGAVNREARRVRYRA